MACNWIEIIDENQCVGDSLDIINDNFRALQNAICALYDLFPPGLIIPYAGTTAPSGWHICDGTYVSQITYSSLYALVGQTYGPNIGNTFKLPDMRGRTAIGVSTSPSHPLAQTGGTETVALTSANQNAQHTHPVSDPGHSHTATATPHNHTIANDSHTHTINDSGHVHAVYYGMDPSTLTGSTSATANPGNVTPTTAQISYGNTNARVDTGGGSATSVYRHQHSIGPYYNGNTCPHAYWFSDVDPGGGALRLYNGDTASGYWFVNANSKTTANPVQVTVKATTTGITLNAAATNIQIQPRTPAVSVSLESANLTVGNSGSGAAHNNMQPFLVLNFIIKMI